MSRDWQKDMEHLTLERERWQIMSIKSDVLDVGIYWLQQYAELKEECDEYKSLAESLNADIRISNEEISRINDENEDLLERSMKRKYKIEELNNELKRSSWLIETLERAQKRLERELNESKENEHKMRVAIETAINEKAAWGDPGNALDVVTRYLADVLDSLYPKEETKPAVLEEEEA